MMTTPDINTSKRQMWVIHALKRARQRYGLVLLEEDLDYIADKIKRGHATKLSKLVDKKHLYIVTVYGKSCLIVFDRRGHRVVTFLPPDELDRQVMLKEINW